MLPVLGLGRRGDEAGGVPSVAAALPGRAGRRRAHRLGLGSRRERVGHVRGPRSEARRGGRLRDRSRHDGRRVVRRHVRGPALRTRLAGERGLHAPLADLPPRRRLRPPPRTRAALRPFRRRGGYRTRRYSLSLPPGEEARLALVEGAVAVTGRLPLVRRRAGLAVEAGAAVGRGHVRRANAHVDYAGPGAALARRVGIHDERDHVEPVPPLGQAGLEHRKAGRVVEVAPVEGRHEHARVVPEAGQECVDAGVRQRVAVQLQRDQRRVARREGVQDRADPRVAHGVVGEEEVDDRHVLLEARRQRLGPGVPNPAPPQPQLSDLGVVAQRLGEPRRARVADPPPREVDARDAEVVVQEPLEEALEVGVHLGTFRQQLVDLVLEVARDPAPGDVERVHRPVHGEHRRKLLRAVVPHVRVPGQGQHAQRGVVAERVGQLAGAVARDPVLIEA
mmetsp:Transcript_21333/g.48103  ORF Transcript_21333/g.48103 Transcript_21333/m.48103 type:complete len:449 (-) Transcript_21333:534-1880(-)